MAIVNVTSTLGDRGFPAASLYVASKHAVIGLTRSAALEADGYGVQVSAVGPGPVQTAMLDPVTGHDEEDKLGLLAMGPIGRAGDPDEIAR